MNKCKRYIRHQSMYPHYDVTEKIHMGHCNVFQNSSVPEIVMSAPIGRYIKRYFQIRDPLYMSATNGFYWSTSHTSKFSNTFCCKCHKGEVYFKKQSFTSVSSENILLGVKL